MAFGDFNSLTTYRITNGSHRSPSAGLVPTGGTTGSYRSVEGLALRRCFIMAVLKRCLASREAKAGYLQGVPVPTPVGEGPVVVFAVLHETPDEAWLGYPSSFR